MLIGRLTRDPNVTMSADGQTKIARYTLAVDRRVRRDADANQQTADFINCVAFGRLGDFADQYLRQGTKIAVIGHIQTGRYTNKDGQTVYTTDVVVEEHEFAESKASQGGAQAPASAGNAGAKAPAATTNDGFMNVDDGIEEDLPFA